MEAGDNVVAVCDVSASNIARLKTGAGKLGAAGASVERATVYEDYRKLLCR